MRLGGDQAAEPTKRRDAGLMGRIVAVIDRDERARIDDDPEKGRPSIGAEPRGLGMLLEN